jgi:hypothetical protein
MTYAMPYLVRDIDMTGCPHACTFLIVRRTSLYLATQYVCPRSCLYPRTNILWRSEHS